MAVKKVKQNKIQKSVIYQTKSGAIELRGDATKETIWATLNEIAFIFGVQKAAISKHIKNIYRNGELIEKATVSKMETVQKEGKREVLREIEYYNLDVIIAVGYRVNSKTATQFRIWATKTLREYIIQGYIINPKQISKNYDSFMQAVSNVQSLLPEHVTLNPKMILELIKEFAGTWVSLDAYDHDNLKYKGITKKKIKVDAGDLVNAVVSLKQELINKGEATDIFAQDRNHNSIQGILGNVMQSFGGKDVYPTLEEKAAHLLYFFVKNHPFVDGNKRSGAFAFIWFLCKYGVRGGKNINPSGLTALTVLIAESNPKHKDKMTALIVELLRNK